MSAPGEEAWFAKPWKERKALIEKYKDHSNNKFSFADIARMLGVSRQIIRETYHSERELKRHGSERDRRIIDLDASGLGWHEIAAHIGVVYNTVRDVLQREAGSKIRPKSASAKSPSLSERQSKEVLRLWNLGDMSHPMIATHLRITEAQVNRAIHIARKSDPNIRRGYFGGIPKAKPSAEEWGARKKATKLINRELRPGEPKPIVSPEEMGDGCMYIHGDPLKKGWQQCGHNGYPWCEWHLKQLGIQKKPESDKPLPPHTWQGW